MKTIKKFLFSLVLLTIFMSFRSMDNSSVLRVTPMPIKTSAYISCDYAIQKIEVYNLLGIQVLNTISEGTVDFSNLPSGFYIIKAYTSKGEFVKRVQKN